MCASCARRAQARERYGLATNQLATLPYERKKWKPAPFCYLKLFKVQHVQLLARAMLEPRPKLTVKMMRKACVALGLHPKANKRAIFNQLRQHFSVFYML